MEEKTSVSFVAFESMKATMERTIKRLWILAIILVLLLFGSNAAWMHYENSFTDEITETIETSTDGGGDAYGTIVSGSNNGVTYGQGEGNQNNETNP